MRGKIKAMDRAILGTRMSDVKSDRRLSILLKTALLLFAVSITLSVNAVKLSAGPLPLRSVFLLGSGAILFLAMPKKIFVTFAHCWRILLVLLFAALLGVFTSILSHADIVQVTIQVFEIHVQAAIGIIIVYTLVLHFGPRVIIATFLAALAFSAIFAVGQALGVNAAWEARAIIGRLSNDTAATQDIYISRARAMGLAYSPVLFATHTCLAIAALFAWRALSTDPHKNRSIDWALLVGCLIFGLLAAVTGNRSPLLGMAIFFAIYFALRAPGLLLIVLPALLLASVAAQPILESMDDAGVRVASTDDGSAVGRTTLRNYGWMLVQARPMGYGLTFDSMRYAEQFFSQLRYEDGPQRVRQWPVHNYFLLLLGKYGFFILALIPIILPTSRATLFLWLGFVPYIVHIYFHNEGPLQSDFLIFFILAAVINIARTNTARMQAQSGADEAQGRRWRRAFAPAARRGNASGHISGQAA